MQLHVVVRGRVQGVGFRWFVREAARRAAIGGWVANRPDGGVEVAAEGTEAEIKWLLEQLREGPPGATVTAIEELPPDVPAAVRPFTIRR